MEGTKHNEKFWRNATEQKKAKYSIGGFGRDKAQREILEERKRTKKGKKIVLEDLEEEDGRNSDGKGSREVGGEEMAMRNKKGGNGKEDEKMEQSQEKREDPTV